MSDFEKSGSGYSQVRPTEHHKIQILHPQLRFLNSFFKVVNASIKEKNSFTENFCQNLYNLKLLHKMLLNSQLDVSVKYSITNYIMESFILTDISPRISQIYIIEKVLSCLLRELESGINTMLDQSEDFYNMCDVVVVDESGCSAFQEILEDYLVLLSRFFQ